MPKHDKPQINWIDINKELPPIGEEVMVYSRGDDWFDMRLDTLNKGDLSLNQIPEFIYFGSHGYDEVTHWSPRPNIPGEKVKKPSKNDIAIGALMASKRKTVTKVCPGCGKSFECLPSAKACKECSPRLRRERFNKKHASST